MVVGAPTPVRTADEAETTGAEPPQGIIFCQRISEAQGGRNLVQIKILKQVSSPVADVPQFQFAIAEKFPFYGQIPLPSVGQVIVGADTVTGRARGSKRSRWGCNVQGAGT